MKRVKDPTICPYCETQGIIKEEDGPTKIWECPKCGAIGGTGDKDKNVLWGTHNEIGDEPYILLQRED